MAWDEGLLRLINQTTANRFCDAVMPWLTRGDVVRYTLAGVGVGLLVHAVWRGDRPQLQRAGLTVLLSLLAVALCETLGSHLIRPWVARPRPPRCLPDVRLLVSLGPSFSFPSAHAANTAAVGTVVGRAYPRLAVPLLGFAAVIAYSRVYVGVHHPFDVVAGAALGVLVGALLSRFADRLWTRSDDEQH